MLLLPAAIFSAVVLYNRYDSVSATASGPGQRGELVWAGGTVIFANTNEIAAWMRQHGSSFQEFKRKHPDALRLLTQPKTPTTATKVAASSGTPKAVESPSSGSSGGLAHDRVGLAALGVLAALLLLMALAPASLLIRLRLPRVESTSELRIVSAAAAAAIGAGLAVALLL